jgi:hypothetical protein
MTRLAAVLLLALVGLAAVASSNEARPFLVDQTQGSR